MIRFAAVGKTRDPLVGTIVDGRYRVTAMLGEGGMAVVYLAHHVTLQRHVALKVLRPVLANNDRAIARFAREARAASLLDHEGLVSVLDFGLAPQGFYYLAMEYVAGTSLDVELGRAAPFAPARATHIVAQIAAAAAHGHARGIVHRDLKPENVMLTTRGADRDFVKVVDFGLAKPTLGDAMGPSLTQPGDLFGTPHYMAPELWRAEPPDGRADVYALGVILYETLCGELPFEGNTPIELMHGHLQHDPGPPSRRPHGQDVPAVLDEVTVRCLSKDPAARYRSMDAFLTDLGRAWDVLRAPGLRTSYAGTGAAPGRARMTIDPTLYQPAEVDVVWDGPLLAEEITHLQALRRRRLAEVADALWPGTQPDGVVSLRLEIESLESHAVAAGQRLAVLRADLEEMESTVRLREAELRGELVDANLARVAQHVSTLSDLGTTEDQITANDRDPLSRLHRADRRLASFETRALEERLHRQLELGDALSKLSHIERELGARYESLGRLVQEAGESRPELRSGLVAYGEMEGALAAYEALLCMWEDAE